MLISDLECSQRSTYTNNWPCISGQEVSSSSIFSTINIKVSQSSQAYTVASCIFCCFPSHPIYTCCCFAQTTQINKCTNANKLSPLWIALDLLSLSLVNGILCIVVLGIQHASLHPIDTHTQNTTNMQDNRQSSEFLYVAHYISFLFMDSWDAQAFSFSALLFAFAEMAAKHIQIYWRVWPLPSPFTSRVYSCETTRRNTNKSKMHKRVSL